MTKFMRSIISFNFKPCILSGHIFGKFILSLSTFEDVHFAGLQIENSVVRALHFVLFMCVKTLVVAASLIHKYLNGEN